jgi:hypothetical protein
MAKTNSILKRMTSFVLSLVFILSTFAVLDFSKPIEAKAEDGEYYMFTYFTGNQNATTTKVDNQAVRFAVSDDGYNFYSLNSNNPVVTQTDADGTYNCRDPYIFRGQDNYYYMIATDADYSTGSWYQDAYRFVVWRSTDLINWSNDTTIDLHDVPGCGNDDHINYAWAPQVIWDTSMNKYMVYFAFQDSKHSEKDGVSFRSKSNAYDPAMYYCYADDLLDPSTWSEPQLLFDFDNGHSSIDGDITYEDGIFYMLLKDDEGGEKTLHLVKSETLTGPYEYVGQFNTKAYSDEAEGCQIYMIQDEYFLVLDRHNHNGHFGMYCLGSRLDALAANGSGVIDVNAAPCSIVDRYNAFQNIGPRHGYIMKINRGQYDRLVNHYGCSVKTNDVKYEFNKAHSNGGNTYVDSYDSSGLELDFATQGHAGGASVHHNSHMLALDNAVAFINESKVRSMITDNNYTVSFSVLMQSDSPTSTAAIFSISNNTPSDLVLLKGDGTFTVNGTSGGTATISPNIEYNFEIVSNGTTVTLYQNGSEVGHVDDTITFSDAAGFYVALGSSDALSHNTSASNCIKANYQDLRFRDYAVSDAQAKSETLPKAPIWKYDGGTTDGINNRNNVYSTTDDETTFSGDDGVKASTGFSYTISAWVNPGSTVTNNAPLFEIGDTATGYYDSRYLNITENGTINFDYGNGSIRNTASITNVFDGSLSANTWYYLTIKIYPGLNWDTVVVYLNGVQKSSSYPAYGVDVDSENVNYLKVNDFMRNSNCVTFGKGLIEQDTSSDCYIDDFRIYDYALDVSSLYDSVQTEYTTEKTHEDAAAAKTYLDTNLASATPKTFTADAYFYDDTATGGFSNVVYCTKGSGGMSKNGVYRQASNVYLYLPNTVVLVYDGVNEVSSPIVASTYKYDQGNVDTQRFCYIASNNATAYFNNQWDGFDTTEYSWPTTTSNHFGYLTLNGQSNLYDVTNTTPRFWRNKLVFNITGAGNVSNFYDTFSNISFSAMAIYNSTLTFWNDDKTEAMNNNLGTSSTNYVINYKPIYDILKSSSPTAVPNHSDYTLKTLYTAVAANPSAYTKDSVDDFYLAAKKVVDCDPNAYDAQSHPNGVDYSTPLTGVTNASTAIKNAVTAFNGINLVQNISYSSLQSKYEAAKAEIAKIGTSEQRYTTESLLKLNDVCDSLTFTSDNKTIDRDNMPYSTYQTSVNAEETALDAATSGLVSLANVSALVASRDAGIEKIEEIASNPATFTSSSVRALIVALLDADRTISNRVNLADTAENNELIATRATAVSTAVSNLTSGEDVDMTVFNQVVSNFLHLDRDIYDLTPAQANEIAEVLNDMLDGKDLRYIEESGKCNFLHTVSDSMTQDSVNALISMALTSLTTHVKAYDINLVEGNYSTEVEAVTGSGKFAGSIKTVTSGSKYKGAANTKAVITANTEETAWYMEYTSSGTSRTKQYQGFGEEFSTTVIGNMNIYAVQRDEDSAPYKVTILREYVGSGNSNKPEQLIDFSDATYPLPTAPLIPFYTFDGYYLNDVKIEDTSVNISGDTTIIAKYNFDPLADLYDITIQNLSGETVETMEDSPYNTRLELEGPEGTTAWVETPENGSERLIYIGKDTPYYVTESVTLKPVSTYSGYSVPNVNLKYSDCVVTSVDATHNKFIFNGQLVDGGYSVVEYGILIGKSTGEYALKDDDVVLENTGDQGDFKVFRAKSTKLVGANQFSIGVTANITSGSIKYKAYAVYQNGSQLITVYSDTNTYTFS